MVHNTSSYSHMESIWYRFSKPFEEPDSNYIPTEPYWIERKKSIDGEVVWFGLNITWVKKPWKQWKKFEDGVWTFCKTPVYEKKHKS